MVEELGVPYTLHKIDIGAGDQFTDAYTAINPNQKIPAIVDSEGPAATRGPELGLHPYALNILASLCRSAARPDPYQHPVAHSSYTVIESGAILMYLAEKHGRFLPTGMAERYEVIQWLMLQMGGVGPMFGQAHHFRMAAKEEVPYGMHEGASPVRNRGQGKRAIRAVVARVRGIPVRGRLERFTTRGARVPRGRLLESRTVAVFPWTARYEWQRVALDEFPNVARWYRGLEQRPAVARGMEDAFA